MTQNKIMSIPCLGVLLLLSASCTKNLDDVNLGNGQPPYVYTWDKIADSSTAALNFNYWNNAGYYNENNAGNTSFAYWFQAHALDVLVDAYLRTSSATYTNSINSWYTGVSAGNGGTFTGQYYDDMGWIALASLRAYGVTQDARFRTVAQHLWTDIQTGWNATMGGGIAWQKQQLYYKNTAANGTACILATRLYEQFRDPGNLAWGKQIYDWWKSTLVDPATGMVYDGINQNGDGKVQTSWHLTYNQGLFIGAAIELYNATGDPMYMNDAIRTANHTLSDPLIAQSGLLRDEGGGDAGLFKGIFVRYLIQLILNKDIDQGYRGLYVNFLKYNAQTLWLQGTARPAVLFGTGWSSQPSGTSDLSTELSGCMLMEGMALMKKNKLF